MDTLFLQTLFEPGDVFEIRILGATAPGWRTPHTDAGYFDYEHINDIPQHIAELASYNGVYLTLNPVNPALLARANNRIVTAQRNATTSDGDILCRRWLFFDIDPIRPAGISATNEEHDNARKTAIQLRDILTDRGWPLPIEVDSGNGNYLLYMVDLPANDNGICGRVLKAVSDLVKNDLVDIDTSVSNAARIARIPGTWNRKGENIPIRPWRMAETICIPDELVTVTSGMLEAILPMQHAVAAKPAPVVSIPDGARPGDRFNESTTDLADLLTRHGWQLVADGPNQQWRRPGKTDGTHSATWNGSVFYVFSSAAAPFEANKGYSAFAVYAMLEHGGDCSAAAKDLSRQGYSDPMATWPGFNGVDLSEFLGQFEVTPESRTIVQQEEVFPAHLLCPPGFMGDVIHHNMETAPKQQPILALAGAIALQAVLCSRKVKTRYGTRPNVMICGIAPSGAGKEHARALNRQILAEVDWMQRHAEGIKSGSGLVNALEACPAILFQIDEYGRFLKASRNADRNPYAYEIVSKLLTLYSSSGSRYESDRYADRDKGGKEIHAPHAIVYGTTVPKSLYEGLSEESVTDGFLARTLIFDAGYNQPARRILSERRLPESILDTAKWWRNYEPVPGNLGNEKSLDAYEVPVSADALYIAQKFIKFETEQIHALGEKPCATLWTRTAQNADKLALLYAVSVQPDHPEINEEAAKWGYSLATYLTQHMVDLISENIAANPFEELAQKIVQIIKRNNGAVRRRELLKRSKVKTRELDEALNYLAETDQIKCTKYDTKSKPYTEYMLL